MSRPIDSPPRTVSLAILFLAALPSLGEAPPLDDPDPRRTFFDRVAALCGEAFEGFSSFPSEGDFSGKLLVAEIAACGDNEIRIPFAVADDRSRTWILRLDDEGLLLQHDHRHEDGTPDEITMYGGWAIGGGSALSQSFAADAHTRELLPAAATNVWTLTLDPEGDHLRYYLERHARPRFEATLERRR